MALEDDPSIRLLALEQKLASYEQLHAEELNELSLALLELRRQLLDLAHPRREPAADECSKGQASDGSS